MDRRVIRRVSGVIEANEGRDLLYRYRATTVLQALETIGVTK